MATHPDLAVAGQDLLTLTHRVTDDDLTLPTPCRGRTVDQLLGHVVGLVDAFTAAARKELGPLTDTSPDNGWPAAPEDWRTRLEVTVPALVGAWSPTAAWQGMTRAGGQDLPGEVAGLVALDELVLHAWDLAAATGQQWTGDPASVEAAWAFVHSFPPEGTPGLFGPAVPVPDDAPLAEQLLAHSGRDPRWAHRIG